MRQAIRALGWTTTIATLIVAIFLATSMYSMFSTLMGRGIGFGSYQAHASKGVLVLSFPFFLNNTGYYDISKINLTTSIRDYRGILISKSTTLVERIAKGSLVREAHNVSISLTDIITKNLTHLLLQDSEIKVDLSMGFRYAYAFSFQVTIPNMSMPWGAPFYNLSVGEILPLYNGTHYLLNVSLGFENHSSFSIMGTLILELHNELGEILGSGTGDVDVPPGSKYRDQVKVVVDDILKLTKGGYVRIYFNGLGPVEIPYG